MTKILLAHSDHELTQENTPFPGTVIDPIRQADLYAQWIFDPIVLLITIGGVLYLLGFRQVRSIRRLRLSGFNLAAFLSGFFILVLALSSPIDFLADYSFFFHMIQHILLIQVAAPLICISAPHVFILKGLEQTPFKRVAFTVLKFRWLKKILAIIISPIWSLLLLNLFIWFWHIPYFYNLALSNEWYHNLEHAMFFYSGIVFFWNLFTPGAAPKFIWLLKMLWIMLSMFLSGILAALITFSDEPLYAFNDLIRVFSLDSLDDQRIGALFMWVPGSFIYFICLGVVFFKGARQENKVHPTYGKIS